MPSKSDWEANRIAQRAEDILLAIRRIRTYIQGIVCAFWGAR